MMKRVNPLVKHPLMRKGGAHTENKSAMRSRSKASLGRAVSQWLYEPDSEIDINEEEIKCLSEDSGRHHSYTKNA